jgi:hypothetical protein
LDINDDGGLAEFLGQALVIPTELLDLLFLRTSFGLGAALVRGQALEDSGLPLSTPGDEVRGVEALAALQGANGAGLGNGVVGLR